MKNVEKILKILFTKDNLLTGVIWVIIVTHLSTIVEDILETKSYLNNIFGLILLFLCTYTLGWLVNRIYKK